MDGKLLDSFNWSRFNKIEFRILSPEESIKFMKTDPHLSAQEKIANCRSVEFEESELPTVLRNWPKL